MLSCGRLQFCGYRAARPPHKFAVSECFTVHHRCYLTIKLILSYLRKFGDKTLREFYGSVTQEDAAAKAQRTGGKAEIISDSIGRSGARSMLARDLTGFAALPERERETAGSSK